VFKDVHVHIAVSAGNTRAFAVIRTFEIVPGNFPGSPYNLLGFGLLGQNIACKKKEELRRGIAKKAFHIHR
jgi:hypothetical protein